VYFGTRLEFERSNRARQAAQLQEFFATMPTELSRRLQLALRRELDEAGLSALLDVNRAG
jgi:hypothetical protein